MRKIILFFFLLCSMTANGQSLLGKPFIAVKGSARTEVVPDTFPLKVTLSETSVDTAGARARIEALAGQVVKLADELKVKDSDMDVRNLRISPEFDYDGDHEKTVFLGNEVEREIILTFRALPDLSEFVQRMPTGTSVRVATEKFTNSKSEEVKRELRRQAIEAARKNASDMADAAGKKLLALHNISDSPQDVSYSGSRSYIGTVNVTALPFVDVRPGASVVLREGVVELSADAYLVFLIGD